jgi:hypothetical protein
METVIYFHFFYYNWNENRMGYQMWDMRDRMLINGFTESQLYGHTLVAVRLEPNQAENLMYYNLEIFLWNVKLSQCLTKPLHHDERMYR